MERPFPVLLDATGPAEELELWIHFAGPLTDEAQLGIREVISTFVALGTSGGLAGVNVNPGQTSIELAESDLAGSWGHWLFRDVRIDPASLSILLNMVHWLHLEELSVREVRLAWRAAEQLSDPMAIRFPEEWPHLSFVLRIGDLQGDIDLDIELAQPQSNEKTEAIVDAMAMWLLATHRGAYADDTFDPSHSVVYLGPDVMDVSPDRIIWFIEVLRCNELALDGLINLLEGVHQRIAPIRSVEFGPLE